MMQKVGRQAASILGRMALAVVSGLITWLVAYWMYRWTTATGSYTTDSTHIWSAIKATLGSGEQSIWPHVAATIRRALLVASGSLLIAVALGPVFAFLQRSKWTRPASALIESLLETWRVIPITVLFVLLAFSLKLGGELTYILVPLPITTAILSAAIMLALKSRSRMREHFYRQTFKRQLFLRLTLPELYFAIRSDLRQCILYAVLLVVVLEYVQQPLSNVGVGAYYYQLFATPPAPEDVFAMALPPLIVIAAMGALIVGMFDLGGRIEQ